MTDEYFDQIDQIINRRWTAAENEEAARSEAYGKMYDEGLRTARAAWEHYGVDPDSPLLRAPYVRNDGASRIGPNGEVYGGGLDPALFPAPPKWFGAADIPAIPGMHGAGSVEAYLRMHPEPYAAPYAPPVEDDGSLMMYAIFGLFLAFIVALPFMLWTGG